MRVRLFLFLLFPSAVFCQNPDPQRQSYLAHIAAANAAFRLNEPAEAARWTAGAPVEQRGWEWRYLDRLSNGSRRAGAVEEGTPFHLALSPDGQTLALTCSDGAVQLRRSDDFSRVQTFTLPGVTFYESAFSPDGNSLYTVSRDTLLRCRELATGKIRWAARTGGYGLACVAAHPDGQRVAVGGWIREKGRGVTGFITLFDASDGKMLARTEFGVKPIRGLQFSADGRWLAAGNWDGEVGVWDAAAGLAQPLHVFDYADHLGYTAIDDVAFSPDGKHVVSATKCGEPRIWAIENGRQTAELRGHRQAVMAVAFSADGRQVFTAGDEGVLHTWDAATGRLLARQYAAGGRITRICPTPDGQSVLTLSDDRQIRNWPARGGLDFTEPGGRASSVYAFQLSNDGKRLGMAAPDGQVSLWDAPSGKMLRMLDGVGKDLNALAISPDGEFVLGCQWDKEVYVWAVQTGAVVHRLDGPEGGSTGCAFSPDGKWAVVASSSPFVYVWEVPSGRLAHKLDLPGGSYAVAFSPDGKTLATAGLKGKVVLWETGSFQKTLEWQAHDQALYSLAFSPDGRRLLTGSEDKTARVWDTRDGALQFDLKGHAQRIWSVAWSADGSRLATASGDLTAGVWDARNGEPVLRLSFTETPYNLLFSPADESLLVNEISGSVRVFRVR